MNPANFPIESTQGPDARPYGMKLLLILLTATFLTNGFLSGQIVKPPYNKAQQWFAYSGDHAVAGKWGLHFDGGFRQTDYSTWNQWLVRPGVNYQVNRNVQLSAAYGYFNMHPGGLSWAGGSVPEHRVQQQAQITKPMWKIPLRHRFRADQRFIGSGFKEGVDRTWNWQHRARYMIRSDIPLIRGANERSVLSMGLYNEIFWRYDQKEGSSIDQNRTFAGFTYRPTKTFAFEVGAFNQHFQPMNGGRYENNMVLLVGFSNTVPLSRIFGKQEKDAKLRPAPKR